MTPEVYSEQQGISVSEARQCLDFFRELPRFRKGLASLLEKKGVSMVRACVSGADKGRKYAYRIGQAEMLTSVVNMLSFEADQTVGKQEDEEELN